MSAEAYTSLYFVRHVESRFIEGQERERGLTEQGDLDAEKVAQLLHKEDVEVFYSSPYLRAVHTIQRLADLCKKPVLIHEDLRERALSVSHVKRDDFLEAKRQLYHDASFAFPGGESGIEARARAINMIEQMLDEHRGKKIVIGTHGDIMTLIFQHYNPSYGFDFWKGTTMPDIYRMDLDQADKMLQITRMWE
ncbi:histidine phosphatase family protein [Paenibacillus polysaccharolyticus]|uniref:histidine phosphatase family protein n=1 Tax=Paenibacillus polysaccharolyticus TaxID=582692 RepID=UPI00203F50E2|nr:histidine phosphatase family protein [Paenibacillus polysaccharolyticus]MCM3132228.1 histidine phosphatase family protein [Paenibacillus polysaccharolyticus]